MANDAALGDLVEFIHKENRACKLHIGLAIWICMWRSIADGSIQLHAIGMQMEHDRRFHLARMPHSTELGFSHFAQRFCREAPVGSEYKACFWCCGFEFTECCPERRVVA